MSSCPVSPNVQVNRPDDHAKAIVDQLINPYKAPTSADDSKIRFTIKVGKFAGRSGYLNRREQVRVVFDDGGEGSGFDFSVYAESLIDALRTDKPSPTIEHHADGVRRVPADHVERIRSALRLDYPKYATDEAAVPYANYVAELERCAERQREMIGRMRTMLHACDEESVEDACARVTAAVPNPQAFRKGDTVLTSRGRGKVRMVVPTSTIVVIAWEDGGLSEYPESELREQIVHHESAT